MSSYRTDGLCSVEGTHGGKGEVLYLAKGHYFTVDNDGTEHRHNVFGRVILRGNFIMWTHEAYRLDEYFEPYEVVQYGHERARRDERDPSADTVNSCRFHFHAGGMGHQETSCSLVELERAFRQLDLWRVPDDIARSETEAAAELDDETL